MRAFDTPPPGFTGLDPGKPVTIYRRHLPHWRQEGATYFVTFRLADSLPSAKLIELREDRERWIKQHPDPSDTELEQRLREVMEKVEKWLDQGAGSCVLRGDAVAEIVEGRLRHFEREQYELFSFVIMPNHVHACIRPLVTHDLDDILRGWKGVSSRMIGRRLSCRGHLWQDESFDRIVRDSAHLRRVVEYIEGNPSKAGVATRRWTTPAWDEWLGRMRK